MYFETNTKRLLDWARVREDPRSVHVDPRQRTSPQHLLSVASWDFQQQSWHSVELLLLWIYWCCVCQMETNFEVSENLVAPHLELGTADLDRCCVVLMTNTGGHICEGALYCGVSVACKYGAHFLQSLQVKHMNSSIYRSWVVLWMKPGDKT